MRGNTKAFTLRKGIVDKQLSPNFYQITDILTNQKINTSLSGRSINEKLQLQIGAIVYVIVSKNDLTRGRLAVEGHRNGLEAFEKDKALLDKNLDPLRES